MNERALAHTEAVPSTTKNSSPYDAVVSMFLARNSLPSEQEIHELLCVSDDLPDYSDENAPGYTVLLRCFICLRHIRDQLWILIQKERPAQSFRSAPKMSRLESLFVPASKKPLPENPLGPNRALGERVLSIQILMRSCRGELMRRFGSDAADLKYENLFDDREG